MISFSSKRNVDHNQFCNYVYKLVNEIESEEIDEDFCESKLGDFFGKSNNKNNIFFLIFTFFKNHPNL